jgi:4-amino-4-deoxy-L-arabinose transferase-like glycosyltransferase
LLAAPPLIRLVGVRLRPPFPLLNPDEESIVPRAWDMRHGGGLDPEWFDYPTLLMYAIAPFQGWADDPSYLAGRLVVVALGLAGIAAAWWLGYRAYGTMAGFVAGAVTAVEVTHVAYSRMAVTDVPMTLGVAVALGLMVTRRLPAAGVAIGVAAGFKYPAFTLLVPLVVAGWGQWRRLAISAALAPLAFAVTSPFFLVHLSSALGDVRRVQDSAAAAGSVSRSLMTPIAFLDRLSGGMGPALLVALSAGPRADPADPRRQDPRGVRLAYFATLLPWTPASTGYVLRSSRRSARSPGGCGRWPQ